MHGRVAETPELSRFYTFAVWMVGDRTVALARAAAALQAAPNGGLGEWAVALLSGMGKERRGDRRDLLAALDDLLRTDLTVTAGDHPHIQRDPRRLRVLQWELKRSCLFAVMRGVQPRPRACFILHRILALPRDEVAALLQITLNSVNISITRAEQILDDYLAVRCHHVDPRNPCRCETRLGVALERGFIGWPEHRDPFPEVAVSSGKPSDVDQIYATLPRFTLQPEALDMLVGAQQGRAS